MRPTPIALQITEATVQELHQFTHLYEIGGATQMEVRLICLLFGYIGSYTFIVDDFIMCQ